MAQLLIDLFVGYVKNDEHLKSMDIPDDICKICAEYINIDVIKTTKEYPPCDYDIPRVFKAREPNDTTPYFGCESYEITADSQQIQFNSPYCYIETAKEWFRVHGGGGNLNGELGAQHLSWIMKVKYLNVDEKCGEHFPKEATNKLRMMYYSAYNRYETQSTPEKPNLELEYMRKGVSANDMKCFTAQSDHIMVYEPK